MGGTAGGGGSGGDNSPSTPLVALNAVVLDTETTGLDATSARIIQIGAVRIRGGALRIDETFERLVDPGVPIPPATTQIHGLSDKDVAGAPPFAAAAADFERFAGNAVVIGHTISYDLAVFEKEAARGGRAWRRPRALDVRTLAEIAMPTLAQYDLDRIASLLGVEVKGRHTALGDAMATAEIFQALIPHLRQKGLRTLAEVDQATRALVDRQISAGRAPASAAPAADHARSLSRIDSFPYRHVVADVMSAPVLWCEAKTTIREALRLILERRVSSVLVKDAGQGPGIATERDMIRAIDLAGADALDEPVGAIATRPLQSVRQDVHVYRAIGRLDRLNFRHLAVTDETGEVVGMVTTRNLLRHRAQTAIALGDAIDAAETVGELGGAWAQVPLVARSLLEEDVDARAIAGVISTEICALTRRAAELAERRLAEAGQGPPPCAYAVLVLGSAGRGESLLAADQDNAIVYASGARDGPEDTWFSGLATHMCEILDTVGIPYCKGGVMATNPIWRQSVAGWTTTIEGWVRRQRPEDLLNVDIFYDAAVVHGDAATGEVVLAHAYRAASGAPDFLLQLSELARRWQPALTLFNNLKADSEGRYDIKKNGLLPVFTAARVLAIRHQIRARGSSDRLRAAIGPAVLSESDVDTIIEAHQQVLRAALAQQLIDIETGIPPSPRIELKRLGTAEATALRNAVQAVRLGGALVGDGRI